MYPFHSVWLMVLLIQLHNAQVDIDILHEDHSVVYNSLLMVMHEFVLM